jgi:guanosine-3',5'-bis(diphosphate) 3'-pyrophosphohydrolase
MIMIEENRESFFNRIEPFFPPSTLLDVNLAYTLAKYGHRAQVRKELDAHGEPVRYFEHVRRVAIVLIDEAKIVRPEMVIAALLHDGIEDTTDLTPAMIEHCFGTDVVSIVKTLSKVPNEGYLDRFLMSSDWRSYMIKACDRLDNLRSLNSAPVDFQRKQISETRAKYYQLFDRMIVITPTEHRQRAQLMRDQVVMTTERHATLMDAK